MELLLIIFVPLVLTVLGLGLIANAIESIKKSTDELRRK